MVWGGAKGRKESRMILRSLNLRTERAMLIGFTEIRMKKEQTKVLFWPCQVWDISKMTKVGTWI